MKTLTFFLLLILSSYGLAQEVTKSLITAPNNRMQYDIRASHILIKIDKNALPDDTLVAYKKIMTIHNRILKGEAFDKVAKEVSEDPSARDHINANTNKTIKGNNGDVGYFTINDMIYQFESIAYNTQVGKVSVPFRTQFGYHIIKVTDRQPALRQVTVAQIFVSVPTDANEEDLSIYENKINEAYKKLKAGDNWGNILTYYSEDKVNIAKGGQLPTFEVNKKDPEFIKAIYNLKNIGNISPPVQSMYGWHIIKLLKKGINLAQPEAGTIIDSRDAQVYKIVEIGSHVWMAENLKFWADKDSPYYKGVSYFYKGINEYYHRYGRLYSWEVAKEVCPDGWHLPSMDEWYSLINNFGDLYDANDKNPIKKESSKKSKEIKKLRIEINAALREDGLGGFDVLYGGYRDPNPPTTTSYNANMNFLENLAENLADHPGYYFSVENCAFFWSSNDNVEKGMFKKQKANGFQFLKSKWSKPFYPIPIKKLNGCSVRCVKDK